MTLYDIIPSCSAHPPRLSSSDPPWLLAHSQASLQPNQPPTLPEVPYSHFAYSVPWGCSVLFPFCPALTHTLLLEGSFYPSSRIPRPSKTSLSNSHLFSSSDHLSALGTVRSPCMLVAIFLLFLSIGSEVLEDSNHICSQFRAGAEHLLVKHMTGF